MGERCAGVLLGAWAIAAAAITAAHAEPATLLRSATVDVAARDATLPLHFGRMASGEGVWYVLLDTDDAGAAERLGINHAPKLANADVGRAVRTAHIAPDGMIVFEDGRVDFAPVHRVEAGSRGAAFPPERADPGSIGDEDYTPLMRVENAGGRIFNAPVIAFDVTADMLDGFCDGDPDHTIVHDKVVRICPREETVTLSLTEGFSGGHRVLYLSTEADVAVVAALEGATLAQRLDDIAADQGDRPWSAVEPIYVVVNGATGAGNPARQGLESALADDLPPLNIAGDMPMPGSGYSPLWASHPLVWNGAGEAGRERITGEAQVRALARAGRVSGFDDGPVAADGIVVNCPAVARLD